MPLTRPRDRMMMSGTEAFTILQLSRDVTFPMAMPNNAYTIYWSTNSPVTVNIAITNKTTTGFRIVIGIGLAFSMDWVVAEAPLF